MSRLLSAFLTFVTLVYLVGSFVAPQLLQNNYEQNKRFPSRQQNSNPFLSSKHANHGCIPPATPTHAYTARAASSL